MEFIKSARRHGTWLSEVVYILLNVGLVAAIFALVRLDLVILAYGFVVLSKWRVLAVRPRYWWDNIQANLLDMLFGISIVSFLWQIQSSHVALPAQETAILQLAIALTYALWLVLLKPRADRTSVQLQALIGQLFAISALYSIAYILPSFLVVMSMFIVGYIAARHTLNTYEEEDITLFSLIWAFIVAELGWLAYHWTIAYAILFTSSAFQVPAIAILISLLSYFSVKAYTLYKDKGTLKAAELLWPGVFCGGLILVILLFFNGYQS